MDRKSWISKRDALLFEKILLDTDYRLTDGIDVGDVVGTQSLPQNGPGISPKPSHSGESWNSHPESVNISLVFAV